MSNVAVINQQHRLIKITSSADIVLIGAGIMSATFGMFLTILEPTWRIHIYERLSQPAQESSNVWNNAGTGHAAFCELNYTQYNNKNCSVDISKAIAVNEAFEISRQFWAYLVEIKVLKYPSSFINNVPHMSFVWGEENVCFLKKRFQALLNSVLFSGMVYSEDLQQIRQWTPLIIDGRNVSQKIAATRMEMGTDVNFGALTQQLLNELKKNVNFKMYLQHDVVSVQNNNDATWDVHVIDRRCKHKKCIRTNYVFIGAGGRSLNLLQTSGIPEVYGYAGFPVGGQFLVTKNPKIVEQHLAKVYGKASVNAPPMSVPHIDTRILNGEKILLFGPFATFSSKFLKYGSWLDLFHSLNKHNVIPILQAGIDNFDLIKYLISQLVMSNMNRIDELREYYPTVNPSDWTLVTAGQRVQIIKRNSNRRGILQFGTEVVNSGDGTLSALLGASPGASTVVSIILQLLNTMFNNKINSDVWKNKLIDMIPSYTKNLNGDLILVNKIRQYTCNALKLNYIEAIDR
ncbi:probable malate:quinone oxidoreductase [Candidatus Blochmanniella pennsylvanica str. BPEN]|uniref:Probable malate:quinone oxidoreductase n=1 Tax=Blochmanniella pennsylvanica (strain BPEN) TaxID=291272 RepID=MQO_BLOPB|nr:malate dehydrogenase (quinone) [Candidatus Blochmannia pennsylvanicus]Q492E3.1 RecName: Full=Probable malate:quinone oxidoreductase; AltName: Full=MQO; AltName: Full=Malate dehydrogenase [quinone] [Candidatus Blochmannia pennsylvanicus str. BPEN]AAZ41158.1 probable malate:quinone oxidoreductase [Candidatus Blochmannia pennsylvanicus str. BPEN]